MRKTRICYAGAVRPLKIEDSIASLRCRINRYDGIALSLDACHRCKIFINLPKQCQPKVLPLISQRSRLSRFRYYQARPLVIDIDQSRRDNFNPALTPPPESLNPSKPAPLKVTKICRHSSKCMTRYCG